MSTKDLNKVIVDMNKVFSDMDKVFSNMSRAMDEALDSVKTQVPWKPWFAWRPVKVHGHRIWLKKIYRRPIPKTYVDYDNWTRYEYGDVFDVIRDTK